MSPIHQWSAITKTTSRTHRKDDQSPDTKNEKRLIKIERQRKHLVSSSSAFSLQVWTNLLHGWALSSLSLLYFNNSFTNAVMNQWSKLAVCHTVQPPSWEVECWGRQYDFIQKSRWTRRWRTLVQNPACWETDNRHDLQRWLVGVPSLLEGLLEQVKINQTRGCLLTMWN